jgi:hypothetical protein
MKAIRINTKTRTLELIDLTDNLEAMQKEVGGYIEVFNWPNMGDVICNEEGTFNSNFGTWVGCNFVTDIHGTSLLVGPTVNGKSTDVQVTVEFASKHIRFGDADVDPNN